MTAVGYLRKSKVTTDRHMSWDVQESEIRALAERHGDSGLELLSDWGRSGRGELTSRRHGFRKLREMIDGGQVQVVYSYSLSRLARSMPEYVSLAEACRDRGVRVRLCKEGEFEYTTASGRLIVDQLARFAQFEAELAQERAADIIKARRARGDYLGKAPYGMQVVDRQLHDDATEDPRVVVSAYEESGSYHTAAKILNASGFLSRHGKPWSVTTVRRVVMRAQGGDPDPQRPGPKPRTDHLFYQLLRCSCGQMLTPRRDQRRQETYVSYLCWRARSDAAHPRPYIVAEAQVRPWIEQEAAKLRVPAEVVIGDEQTASERLGDLKGRRKRILDNYEDGYIDKAERDEKVGVIDDEMQRLDSSGRIVSVPPLDWSGESAAVNAVLRALFRHVQLDNRMRPVDAAWSVAEWRAP